jgi:hypothetical protein
MEMKTRTAQGGVCYPGRLAGINGGQFKSQKTEARSTEVKTAHGRRRREHERITEDQKYRRCRQQ